MLVKCICTNCAGHLEFEEENAGEKIKCPHCRFDTTLFLPGTEPIDDEIALSKRLRFRSKRPLIAAAIAVLVLAGIGYSIYRWVFPPVRDWLPYTESPVLPVIVLGIGCLAVLLLLAWLLFPILIYLQFRKLTQILARIEAGSRQVSSEEPIIQEDIVEEEVFEERGTTSSTLEPS